MKDQINTIRAALKPLTNNSGVRKAHTALSELEAMVGEPAGWRYQHDETGRHMCHSNDGINTPEDFMKANPRWKLIGPMYATPVAQQQGEVVVTWDEQRTRILAVDRMDGKGYIQTLDVIAATPAQQPQAERELRKLLCITYAGAGAYMDDGEAQDNRAHPAIDFMRDTPAEIQHKMRQRSLTAPQQAEAVPQPPEDWSVFNSGAEVASGLTWAEAWDYMTPSRIERGWTAVCVADKSNLGAAIAQQKGGGA